MRPVFYTEICKPTYELLRWLNANACKDETRPQIQSIRIHEGGKILEATNGMTLVRVKLNEELKEKLPAGCWRILLLNSHSVVMEGKENYGYPDTAAVIKAWKWRDADDSDMSCVSVNAKLLGMVTAGFGQIHIFITSSGYPVIVEMTTFKSNMPEGIYIGVLMPMHVGGDKSAAWSQMRKDVITCFNLDKAEKLEEVTQ